jgi:hypothetical protein
VQPSTPLGPDQVHVLLFENNADKIAQTRTICEEGVTQVDGEEVKREPGRDNELLSATVTVMWTVSAVTMIRRVDGGMTRPDQALLHLEETIDQCIHIITDDDHVHGEW